MRRVVVASEVVHEAQFERLRRRVDIDGTIEVAQHAADGSLMEALDLAVSLGIARLAVNQCRFQLREYGDRQDDSFNHG